MSDVRELKKVVAQPNMEVVEFLERALADAKEGKTGGVILLEQDRAGVVSYAISGVKDRFNVLGFLSHAMHRLQRDDAL